MEENLQEHKAEPCSDKCKECKDFKLETLYSVLDGEASVETTEQLRAHIAKCYPCLQHYDLEVAIRQILQEKIEKKCVPDDVIQEIKNKIGTLV